MWNIVVESELVSKWLIDNDCFVKRETCIPNNKISFATYSEKEIKEIELREAPRVHYALNIIRYKENLRNTMNFVFGGIVNFS